MTPLDRLFLTGGRWTPLKLRGLVAWYRADSGVYSDAGSTRAVDNAIVQQWNDLSGNGCHLLQATSANRPVFKAAGLRAKPTVSFTATTPQWMTSAVGVPMGAVKGGGAAFFGQMNSASQSNARILSYCPPASIADFGTGGWVVLQRNVSNANINSLGFGAVIANMNAAFSVTNIPSIAVINYSDALAYAYVGDVQSNTPASSYPASSLVSGGYLAVGHQLNAGGVDGTSYYDGFISELIVTNQPLTWLDRQRIVRWLSQQW